MAIYYVDCAAGSDSNPGTSARSAKATLAAGVALLSTSGGDTLNIKASATFTLASTVAFASLAGSAVAVPNLAGVPKVDLVSVSGAAASGVASVDANLVGVNGTAFSGSYVPSNAVQWAGTAVGGMPLAASAYATPPSAAAIDAQLSGTHGAGAWTRMNVAW